MAEPSEHIRLHITPFSASLLNTFLPPSILLNVRNISYHSLETLPEKSYGYIELPMMDAEKIKKKLNGSILKGTKVKIETAKAKKELILEPEDPAYPRKEKPLKTSKKRKRGHETIPAAEIGDRSVKRGWTTPTATIKKREKSKDKDCKAVNKSKFTTGPECLFKTVLPPNVAANIKGKLDSEGKEKKKRRAEKEVVVHEFKKTTKYATFLRGPVGSKKSKGLVEFAERKGWVDEDGNVVEVLKEKKRLASPKVVAPDLQDISEDENSEVSSSSENKSEASESESLRQRTEPLVQDSVTSSFGSSSEEESDSSSEDESAESSTQAAEAPRKANLSAVSKTSSSSSEDDPEPDESSSPKSSSTPKTPLRPALSTSRPQSSSALSIKIPESDVLSNTIHPLEALYKRSGSGALDPKPKPEAPSFSFFGADADVDIEDEEEARDLVPLTSFTEKDFEFRGMRSAAPTPDTAHANKRFIWPADNEDDEMDDGPSSPVRRESSGKGKEKVRQGTQKEKEMGMDANTKEGNADVETDFQKWFYENRGETSRAWKKRRKVVAKEKRQRENRKRNDRGS